MNKFENNHYHTSFTDGVITFKNINTTLGFVRYNEEAEVEYIFVNPIFRRKGLAKKLLQLIKQKTKIKPKPQNPISSLGEKLFKTVKKRLTKVQDRQVTERP
jgi:GNAT superfamily N-acetyltransferase